MMMAQTCYKHHLPLKSTLSESPRCYVYTHVEEKWWMCAKIGSCDRFKGTKVKKRSGNRMRDMSTYHQNINCLDYVHIMHKWAIHMVCSCVYIWSPSHEIPDHGRVLAMQEKGGLWEAGVVVAQWDPDMECVQNALYPWKLWCVLFFLSLFL